ncbi:MAG: beta-propeller domain-containing protein [Myxococcales bacterium]|nr:beta-propeller domain-containing protein [Myxococcales bacterium]
MLRRLSLALAVLAAGCGRGPNVDRSRAALKPVEGCQDLQEHLREVALSRMNQQLDENLQRARSSGCNSWGTAYPSARGADTVMAAGAPAPMSPSTATGSGGGGGSGGASQYSTTNTQVVGVDEADFIKNDASHIYLADASGLTIVRAWPPEQSQLVSRTPISGTAHRLFVERDRAAVFSRLTATEAGSSSLRYASGRECTYGYDCEFTGDGFPMQVTVLDISDRAKPVVLREIRTGGSYLNSRRVGSAVHAVVTSPSVDIPGLRYWPQNLACNPLDFAGTAIASQFEELRRQNAQLIREADLLSRLPVVQERRSSSEPFAPAAGEDCQGFYRSQLGDGDSFIGLLSLDIAGLGEVASTTVVGRPGAVYATSGALYIASRHQHRSGESWFFADASAQPEASTIHRFALENGERPSASYQGSGVVKGRVLNQFALDEHQGFLRIATTTGRLPDPKVHSTITVLEPTGAGLEEVGQIDQIAPSEDIRSVRFEGGRGFVVTFKKTDPLFVLDLKDPAAPAIVGELKIPGFSTYMHMLDDDHVLSIGYDAADQGSFAFFQGIQLQIFDVSDPAAPQLSQKTLIGTRGTSSEAATNHLAFNFFAPKGLLGVPMAVCESNTSAGSYGATMTFSGLMVFGVSTATGFDYRGGVSHPVTAPTNGYTDSGCYNWWTQSRSKVKRSVFMDDFVYSVATDAIKVNRVDALGSDLAVVALSP